MKFYKVHPDRIIGKILGNSTAPVLSNSSICKEKYIKVDDEGKVFTMYHNPIMRMHYKGDEPGQLILPNLVLEKFEKLPQHPGFKTAKNIRYVIVDQHAEEVESFIGQQEAIERCGYLNNKDTYNWYEIVIKFDFDWEN